MNLHCPNCDTPIPVQNINAQALVAVCPKCSHVFNFASDQQPKRLKRKVKAPGNIKIQQLDGAMIINCNWSDEGSGYIGLLTGGFFFIVSCLVLADGDTGLFFIGLMMSGLFIWLGIANLNKTTIIRLTDEIIYIEPNSLNFKAPLTLKRENVVQFYVKQQTGAARYGTVMWFDLVALTANGEDLVVIDHINSADQAHYLEQVIENYLGLEHLLVSGEYGG